MVRGKRANAVMLAFGFLWGIAPIWAAAGVQGNRTGLVIRKTPAQLAGQGRFPEEEKFVRDVYARLMRYDMAAREYYAAELGEPTAAEDYLVIRLRDMRTSTMEDAGIVLRVLPASGAVETISIERVGLRRGADPEHALYKVAWAGKSVGAPMAGRINAKLGDVDRIVRYTVDLSLQGKSQSYAAVALFHRSAGNNNTLEPEIIDPALPDIAGVAGDLSPLVRSPWDKYTRTGRYRMVIKNLAEAYFIRDASNPIGFLFGDDVEEDGPGYDYPVTECGCAIPTNMRITRQETINSYWLGVYYRWDSSIGGTDISDLKDCMLGEDVQYDVNPYPSPPFPSGNPGTGNIHELRARGNFAIRDTHKVVGTWAGPYVSAEVHATQFYYFTCPCYQNGQETTLLGPHTITRKVNNQGGTWLYKVFKPGAYLEQIIP